MGMLKRFRRIYNVHLVLGDPKAPEAWIWQNWRSFAALLEPLVASARSRAVVSSTQFAKNNLVKFGALTFNEKSHHKWTHNSPITSNSSHDWSFLSTEIWAPSRAICDREQIPPDFFFAIQNVAAWSGGDALSFNPLILIACARDLGNLEEQAVAAKNIALLVNAKLHVLKQRTWAWYNGAH